MVILVTGGAGFIGSHLVDYLMEQGAEVRVLDNLSAGSLSNIETWLKEPRFEFIRGHLLDPEDVAEAVDGCNVVYHLAANPEARISKAKPEDLFKQNVKATHNLLEAIRKHEEDCHLVFTSSSTVYGEASILPTPEDYGPLKPISIYGASKLAAETLAIAYASTYGFRCTVYRLANIIGPRSNHGVVYDFVKKLRRNPRVLEVLGDGTQSKSYLYIDDCIRGMLLCVEQTKNPIEILNIGSEDRVDVTTIAHLVIEEMGLTDIKIRYTGGVDGGRGWRGDVKLMQLDVSRLKSNGWRSRMGSVEAVRETARILSRG